MITASHGYIFTYKAVWFFYPTIHGLGYSHKIHHKIFANISHELNQKPVEL